MFRDYGARMEWSKQPAFINRKKELDFLGQWITEKPEHMLFIYGPKSSGKTTLLYKFTRENLADRRWDVKYFNLREILIANYRDFIQAFFEIDYSRSKEDVKEKREYDLKVFKLTTEVLKGLDRKELDPFVIMKKELMKLTSGDIRPIIIIDELQALQGVYMNGQRELIKELFNFFVAITKESHLCHVIISSSDGYFIERIYSDSKLSKTSRFYEIAYLKKEDAVYWLNNLKKESGIEYLTLTDSQIERMWYYFGGSMWEISGFLSVLMNNAINGKVDDALLEKEAQKEIMAWKVRFQDYLGKFYDYDLFVSVNDVLSESGSFFEKDLIKKFERAKLKEELGILVQKNLFSYNPVTGEYQPQGPSVALGLKAFCDEL
ncbi:MAG: AAA family ATPase [Desulfobacterales bacterium]|nr:AAA family ATPase [Desulfobacterales bacterium]